MVAGQNTQVKAVKTRQQIAIGADFGAGTTKLALEDSVSIRKLKHSSKLVTIDEPLKDEFSPKDGGHFYYHEGTRDDLVGKGFLTGELAQWMRPTSHTRLSDDPVMKAENSLQMLLGVLSTSCFNEEDLSVNLIVSTHSKELFSNDLKDKLDGKHVVSFGSKDGKRTSVYTRVLSVVPEGAGSYIHAQSTGMTKDGMNLMSVDFGTSTIIPQVFSPNGKLLYYQPLEAGGCIDLIGAIAKDPSFLQLLRSGRAANADLIREAIEDGTFEYGRQKFNFSDVYRKHLTSWLIPRLQKSLQVTNEWQDSSHLVAWGGGSQLPYMAQLLKSRGIQVVPNGCWANCLGLQKIAVACLAREKNAKR
ncbi:MAG: hypothetical protein F6K41_24045 [Symploca sp. SIO3E6]|nr:hypothetical protein [Caldora sp. SIO3E6]